MCSHAQKAGTIIILKLPVFACVLDVCMSGTVYSLACLSVSCKKLNVMENDLNLIRFIIFIYYNYYNMDCNSYHMHNICMW